MIKKLTAVLTSALIAVSVTFPAFASASRDWLSGEVPVERQQPRAVDYTDTFSDTQLKRLNSKLDTLSDKWSMDIVCALDYDLGSYDTATEYADDYYDYNGFAEDGILFAVFSESRDWAISTGGEAIDIFDNYENDIVDYLISDLSGDDFYSAFVGYADRCDSLLKSAYSAVNGDSYYNPNTDDDTNDDTNNDADYDYDYDYNNGDDFNFDPAGTIGSKFDSETSFIIVGISVIVGIVCGFIGTGIMKAKLKSVKFQSGAADYVVPDSFKMHDSRDIYLYSTVTKTERPTNNNHHSGGSHGGFGGGFSGGGTHISSSGSMHGGGSGKF